MIAAAPTLLIVEDGDEYLHNLSMLIAGPRYLQAHSGQAALQLLRSESVDLVYLDMRFDRIDPADLVGDIKEILPDFHGDTAKAWNHLQLNQGLYILDYLDRHGFAAVPVLLSYDFSRENRRWEIISRRRSHIDWIGDTATAAEITQKIEKILSLKQRVADDA